MSAINELVRLKHVVSEYKKQYDMYKQLYQGASSQLEEKKRAAGNELYNLKHHETGECYVDLQDGTKAYPRKVNSRKLLLDKGNVPVEYQKEVTVIKPDEAKIKQALLGGLQVNWASLEDEYYTVVIK